MAGWPGVSTNPSIGFQVLPSTEAIVVDASQPKTKVMDFGGTKGLEGKGTPKKNQKKNVFLGRWERCQLTFVVSFFLQFHELDGAKFFMRMYCYLDCCFSGSVPGKVVGALLSPSE